MNIDRLDQIAAWLEAGAPPKDGVDGFDMCDWYRQKEGCGTTCCIAGTAWAWWGELSRWFDIPYSAQELLELSDNQSAKLFHGPSNANPQWAARCIRGLIATGDVDWHRNEDAHE